MTRIIIDVDSVVADLVKGITKLYDPELLTLNDPKEWDWFKKLTPSTSDLIINKLNEYSFWEHLPLIKDAQEGIHYLRSQDHELIWVTMPYESCFGWSDARMKWLDKNFQINLHKEALITVSGGQKYYVRAAAMIDDRVDFIEKWEKANNGIGFVFESQTNKDYPRTYTWEKIMKENFFKRKLM